MKVNPIDTWTTLQKAYYLIQIKRLIEGMGDHGVRGQCFEQLRVDLGIASDTLNNILAVDQTINRTTKISFQNSNEDDKLFILTSYIIILLAEENFSANHHLLLVSMFTNIYGYDVPDTLNRINIIFENNPDLELEFHRRKILDKKSVKTPPEQMITRDTVVFLAIIALAIIGLVSIFT